jgi:hypothetical protein
MLSVPLLTLRTKLTACRSGSKISVICLDYRKEFLRIQRGNIQERIDCSGKQIGECVPESMFFFNDFLFSQRSILFSRFSRVSEV